MENRIRIIPPLYFLLSLIIMAALHYWYPLARLLETPWRFTAVVLLLAGILNTAMAARLFNRLETPIRPFETPQLLVTEGLFAFSRNPMYLGMVIFLIGFAVILGSASPWLVIPAFIWIIQSRFIRVEEAGLEAQYGDEYRRYKHRVRRWI